MTYLRVPPTLEGEPDPARIARLVFGAADWRRRHPAERVIDIAGAWQVLHYLITGDPWDGKAPEADVVCGGELVPQGRHQGAVTELVYLPAAPVDPAGDHLSRNPA